MLSAITLTVGGYEIFMAICLSVSLGISAIGFRNRRKAIREDSLYTFDATGYVVLTALSLAVSGVGSLLHFEYQAGHNALPEAWKLPVERLHELPKSQRAVGLAAMIECKQDWPALTFDNISHIIKCGDDDVCMAACLDVLKPYIKLDPELGRQLAEGNAFVDQIDEVEASTVDGTYAEKRIAALTESN